MMSGGVMIAATNMMRPYYRQHTISGTIIYTLYPHMMNMNHQSNWDTHTLLLSHKNCQNSVLSHYMFCIYHFQDTDDNVFQIGYYPHLLHHCLYPRLQIRKKKNLS